MRENFRTFLQNYESKVKELSTEKNLSYFDASISGNDEDYERSAELEIEMTRLHADRAHFAELKRFKESGEITECDLSRQLLLLYNEYLEKQSDEKKLEEIVRLQTEIEKTFSTFRAAVSEKKYTDNEIEEILDTSTDSELLQSVWEASKQVGQLVAGDVLKLVEMRNSAARELGFSTYHAMQLTLSEQDPDQIEELFDELDALTGDVYAEVKTEIDRYLASKHEIAISDLMPWHYQNRFFQEPPKIHEVNLDKYYEERDLVDITRSYFVGLGLPIEDLLVKSDLFEKDGKYQHAYCMDIDREGDIRVVCNVRENCSWMGTLLHEFGHAVYDKFQDPETPWLLREPAHVFTTEAIAMLFGRFASHPHWMQTMLGLDDRERDLISETSFEKLRMEQLVFSRWVQVMYRFEKRMFEDPAQDLNGLWWQLVEQYQLLEKPPNRNEPDWAAKIHVALYPAYYHNYMMAELLASQLYHYINTQVLRIGETQAESFVHKDAVGDYLLENIFKPGKRLYWNDLIKEATGERLTAKYYAAQFVSQ